MEKLGSSNTIAKIMTNLALKYAIGLIRLPFRVLNEAENPTPDILKKRPVRTLPKHRQHFPYTYNGSHRPLRSIRRRKVHPPQEALCRVSRQIRVLSLAHNSLSPRWGSRR